MTCKSAAGIQGGGQQEGAGSSELASREVGGREESLAAGSGEGRAERAARSGRSQHCRPTPCAKTLGSGGKTGKAGDMVLPGDPSLSQSASKSQGGLGA